MIKKNSKLSQLVEEKSQREDEFYQIVKELKQELESERIKSKQIKVLF